MTQIEEEPTETLEPELDSEMLADSEIVQENAEKAFDAALVTIIYKLMPKQSKHRELVTCVKTADHGPYFQLIGEADLGELPQKVQALLAKLKLEIATNPVKSKPVEAQAQKHYVSPLKKVPAKVVQPSLPVELSTELPAIPGTNSKVASKAKPLVTTQPNPVTTKPNPKPKTSDTPEQGSLFDLL
jgi:hypothetical protein